MHVCQIGEKICTFGKNFDFQKIISSNGNKIKSQADSNSWFAVHDPDHLTTELWRLSTKLIDANNSTKHLNRYKN